MPLQQRLQLLNCELSLCRQVMDLYYETPHSHSVKKFQFLLRISICEIERHAFYFLLRSSVAPRHRRSHNVPGISVRCCQGTHLHCRFQVLLLPLLLLFLICKTIVIYRHGIPAVANGRGIETRTFIMFR